jgi:regulator of sirC expression with transglutaminase-like and TPR domain
VSDLALERFGEFARRPDAELDLAHGALLIATLAYPDLEIDEYLGRLDALAGAAGAPLGGAGGPLATASALARFLYERARFAGNTLDYYDPRNSYLCDVLERRRGIPITLAVVYLEVARRVGCAAYGVGFPGHFLVGIRGLDDLWLDPFTGKFITREHCAERLARAGDEPAELRAEHLAEAPARRILARILGNLKHIHAQRGEFDRALACVDRTLLLLPDEPLELRDRGLLYARLECYGPALRDLDRYRELAPADALPDQLAQALETIRERARHIH